MGNFLTYPCKGKPDPIIWDEPEKVREICISSIHLKLFAMLMYAPYQVDKWKHKYIVTGHWLEDIQFYDDELEFLAMIIDDYYSFLYRDGNLHDLEGFVADIKRIKKQLKSLKNKIKVHLGHIDCLMQNRFTYNDNQFVEEHLELMKTVRRVALDFRKLKTNLYKVTESIMKSDKLRHLLD